MAEKLREGAQYASADWMLFSVFLNAKVPLAAAENNSKARASFMLFFFSYLLSLSIRGCLVRVIVVPALERKARVIPQTYLALGIKKL